MYNKSKNQYLEYYFKQDNHSPVVVELHGFIPAFNDSNAIEVNQKTKDNYYKMLDPLGLRKRTESFKNTSDYIAEDKNFTDIEEIAYVQDYVTSVSWSNSINPPYQTGSLIMKMPLDAAIHYMQGRYIIPNYSNDRTNYGRRSDYAKNIKTNTASRVIPNENGDGLGTVKVDKIKTEIKDKLQNKDGILNPFGRQPSAGGWIVIRSESYTTDDSMEPIDIHEANVDIDKKKSQIKENKAKRKELEAKLKKAKADLEVLEQLGNDGNKVNPFTLGKVKKVKEILEAALNQAEFDEADSELQLQNIAAKLNIVKHPAVFFGKIVSVSISVDSLANENGTKSYANIQLQYEGFLNPLMNSDFVVSVSQGAGATGLKPGTIFQGVDKQGQSDFINQYLKYFLDQVKKRNVKAGDVLQSMVSMFGRMEVPSTILTPLTYNYSSGDIDNLRARKTWEHVIEMRKDKGIDDRTQPTQEELREYSTVLQNDYTINKFEGKFPIELGSIIRVIDGNDKSYGTPYTGCFLVDKQTVDNDPKRSTSKNAAPVFFGADAFSTAINGMKGKKIWPLIESICKPDPNMVEMFPALLPVSSLPSADAIDQLKTLLGKENLDYESLPDVNDPMMKIFKSLGVVPSIIYRFKPVSYTAVSKDAFTKLYDSRIWRKNYLRNKTYSEEAGMSEDMELKNYFTGLESTKNYHSGANSRIIDAKYIHSLSLRSTDSRINCVYTRPATSGKFQDGFELFGALSDPMIDPYSINRYGLSLYETYYPFFNFDNNNAAVNENKVDEQKDKVSERFSPDGKTLITINADGTETETPVEQSPYAVNTIKPPIIFNETGEINEDEIKAGFASQWVVYPNDIAELISSNGDTITYKRTYEYVNDEPVAKYFQLNSTGQPDSLVVDPALISEIESVLDKYKQDELDLKGKAHSKQVDDKGWTPNSNSIEKGIVKDAYILASAISERIFLNIASDCNYYRGTVSTHYNPIAEHVPGTHMAFQIGEWYANYGEAAEPHTDDFNTGERPIGGDPSMETNYGPYPEANNIFLLCYIESISYKIIVNAATGTKTSMAFYEFSRGTIISGVNSMGEPYRGEHLMSQLASKVEVPYMTPYSVSEVK